MNSEDISIQHGRDFADAGRSSHFDTIQSAQSKDLTGRPAAVAGLRGRLSMHGLLLAIVLVTRIPLVGNLGGETDSVRYMIGLHLWVIGDRSNPLIYARVMSPGYYWFGAQLARITHTPAQNYPLMLTIVSLCATAFLAAVTYELSRYVAGDCTGLICTLLFLISPAIWWMGIQPHPQVLSAALAMAALYAYLRGVVIARSILYSTISIALLTAGLLVKIDAVLFFPAFVGLLLFRARWSRETLHRLLLTTAILATASMAFISIRAAILRTGLSQLQAQTGGAVRTFLAIPTTMGAVRQAVPIALALGPVLFSFAVLGVLLAVRNFHGERLARWLLLPLAWCLPSWLFWLLIAGNNPRHVALSMVALLWMGVAGWVSAYGYKTTATVAAIAALLNFASIPANSGTIFLSPNVPGSASALRAKEMQIQLLAEAVATEGGAGCFVGTYTIPYFTLYMLQASKSQAELGPKSETPSDHYSIFFGSHAKQSRYSITCLYVRPEPKIEIPCSPAYSFEYAADGSKRRFLGGELCSSPICTKLRASAGELLAQSGRGVHINK